MHRQRVTSSVLLSVGYDASREILEVEFRTGRVYEYARVPLATYEALMNAESLGSYFNRRIRNRYRSRETTPEGLPLRRD